MIMLMGEAKFLTLPMFVITVCVAQDFQTQKVIKQLEVIKNTNYVKVSKTMQKMLNNETFKNCLS